ncbi:MAG: NAD(P)-dependent oxidoreductase [Candidatus Saccharibacteria bacterium]
MKRIFVIGANSALAKETIKVLSGNYEVITAGRKGCDVYCDIAKEVKIPKKVDVVINFAAAFGGTSDEEITEAINTNVGGLLNVCMAAKASNVKHVINISSVSALLDENSPYYSIYTLTKRQADEVATLYCTLNDIKLTVLRPTQIYGESDEFRKHQAFFYMVLDKAEKGEDIAVYGKHDALRNYIHCSDIANVIERVVKKDVTGTYLCSYPSNVSYSSIAKNAQKIFGKGGKFQFLKDKPDIPDNIFKYDSKLYDKIGYLPKISLIDGLKRIRDYKDSNR